jgi:chemotaxis protein histidine kinase CheA
MSLADLLGAGDGKAEEESPRRVEHRDDEPDSGMVNLAKMVAASSIDVAKTPSMAPPPPPRADQSGVRPMPTTDPSGVVTTQGAMPIAPAPAQKKGSGAIYALIAVIVLVAGGVIFYLMNKEQPQQSSAALDKAAAMMAEMQTKAEADRKAAEEKEALLLAKLEQMSKAQAGGGAVSAEDQAKMDAVKAQLDAAKAEKEAAAKKAEQVKTESAKTGSSKAEKPKKDTTTADQPKKDTTKKTDSAELTGDKGSTTAKKTDTAKGGNAEELDSLLGGGGSKDKAEEKPAAKPVDELPKQPSKDQVTAAMAPIKAKAQASCAKYSTGVVQVSMVVTGEGKVKSATPTGVFAGNPAGTCVAMMARSAKFPKFKDPTYTFIFPITLQ